MAKPLIAVTGKNGQLGWELEQLSVQFAETFDFVFTGREELDLIDPSSIPSFFQKYAPAYFINCGAYTAVDKAETEKEQADTINAVSVGVIAEECSKINCTLVTISTDYVFNGNGKEPYQTDTLTDPINYYGYSKWMGEQLAQRNNKRTIIIRTSWVYSTHGHNFVKTMLRLMKERAELKVVDDQVGSPTYAADLAEAILQMLCSMEKGNRQYGVYHFSNNGVISWYEFAKTIRDLSHLSCEVLPQPSSAYPTPAKRPAYSVMDNSDIMRDYSITIKDWKKSLLSCLGKMQD